MHTYQKHALAFLSFLAVTVVTGCSSASKSSDSLAAQKARLEQLRKELFKLQADIAALETQIAAQDSSFRLSKAVPVSILVPQARTFQTRLRLQGAADNREAITLAAKAAGTLLRLYVQEGQTVTAGQVLAEQDAEVLRKNIAEVRTRLQLATTLYEKQKKLYEEGIGAEVQYLTAKNNKESLEMTLASLEEQLKNAQIRAPKAGRVDAILVKAGELLMPGMPAIRLVSPGTWEIRVEVPERFIERLKPGQLVEVQLPDLGPTFTAPISTLSQVINPLSRTFTLTIRQIPPVILRQLRPGLVAFVSLPEMEFKGSYVIPIEAVQFQDTSAYVFLFQGGRAIRRAVRLLATEDSDAAVEGLRAGDSIIVLGAAMLSEGQAVYLSPTAPL